MNRELEQLLGLQKKRQEQQDYDTLLSLCRALQNAGGAVPTIERLQEMSAMHLILMLAPNNIRFVYRR